VTSAKLHVSVPDGTWIHDVSAAHPDASFRVVAVLSGEGRGVASLELRTGDPVPVIADVERRADVTGFDLLWKQGETAAVQVETTDPRLLSPVLEAGVPLRTPFEVREGVATWELATTTERLSDLGTRLEEAGIGYDVEYVREDPVVPADHPLTDRQREVLVAAAEQGYYDTPRGATLTEVSESLGISKATGSDVLHRAEGKVLTWFVDEHLTAG
jgi:predicted DNA binding protein